MTAALTNAVAGTAPYDLEFRILRTDEEVRTLRAQGEVIRDEWGEPIRIVGTGLDITERKRMEEQLQQQERLAAVGQLAGGIAHDFNNLLATIILYAQMTLGKRDLPPDAVQALETILAESQRAAKLVQQILDFSRRSMIDVRLVDLASFTEGVIGILRRTIPENIRLGLAIEPEEYTAPLTVKADLTRIRQALMNLATNARDAMLQGGELRVGLDRVTLTPREKPPVTEMGPGEWIRLTVSDTGTGMTEEVQAHLFEPFFTTEGPGEGTGLGLAQVYGIVKQHGGHIGVETAAGEGITFHIYLPAYHEEVETEAEEPTILPQGRGETILLVEDETRLRKAIREVLELLGYRVLAAANGRKALEIYRSVEGKVDLVAADLVMPEMGGQQLIQELGKENPHLKALAITGYVMEADQQKLEEEGFLGVVHKPFDADRLARTIRRALDLDNV